MELALSLGGAPKSFSFLDKSTVQEPGHPPVQLDLLPVHRSRPSLNKKLPPEKSIPTGFPIFPGRKRDFVRMNTNLNDEDSRGSDDEEIARKKLRLTKEQSAFLEQSFKEHSTLNPKQKIGLAKQLNLRPRQVEVWFQNRRARTKLKQTEVDCEYLKKCRETLTEENRRLQKELHELRALKASKPFYMQLPATTLTMCPSCQRVATAGGAAPVASNNNHLATS